MYVTSTIPNYISNTQSSRIFSLDNDVATFMSNEPVFPTNTRYFFFLIAR